MIIRRMAMVAAWLVLAAGHVPAADTIAAPASEFMKGADVSSLPRTEAFGGIFTDGGERREALALLRSRGLNWVRLRLFRKPDGAWGAREDLPAMIALAARAHAAGLQVLLDLHCSDTWADPGQQGKPAPWKDLPFPQLRDALRDYTKSVTAAFAAGGALPEMVQVGNEVSNGILWPDGRISGSGAGGWDQFVALLRAGREGVRAGTPPGKTVRFLHHVDRVSALGWQLAHLPRDLRADAYGLSYYPWWHGPLRDFERDLTALVRRDRVNVVIAETAYPWTDARFDEWKNVFDGDARHLPDRFARTPAGQRQFLAALLRVTRGLPAGHGRGVFWWEPAWIAVPHPRRYLTGELVNRGVGRQDLPAYGSPVENMCLFDEHGEALPALDLFR